MQLAGIDIGTTTISAVVLEKEEGKVIESITEPNGSFIQTGEEWERLQDADRIVKKAKAILDALLDTYPQIRAIGLTGYLTQLDAKINPLDKRP